MRVSKEQDHILISPRGLSFAEVTAANLVSTMTVFVVIFQLGVRTALSGNLTTSNGQNSEHNFSVFGEITINVNNNQLDDTLKFSILSKECWVSTVRFLYFYCKGNGPVRLVVILDVSSQHTLHLPDLFPSEFTKVSRCIQQKKLQCSTIISSSLIQPVIHIHSNS